MGVEGHPVGQVHGGQVVPHKHQHHRPLHLGEVVGEDPQRLVGVVQAHHQGVQDGQVLLGEQVTLGGEARGDAVLLRVVGLVVLHGRRGRGGRVGSRVSYRAMSSWAKDRSYR